jgi:hypothetical protein
MTPLEPTIIHEFAKKALMKASEYDTNMVNCLRIMSIPEAASVLSDILHDLSRSFELEGCSPALLIKAEQI